MKEKAERLTDPEVVDFSGHNRAVTHSSQDGAHKTYASLSQMKFQDGAERQENVKPHPNR